LHTHIHTHVYAYCIELFFVYTIYLLSYPTFDLFYYDFPLHSMYRINIFFFKIRTFTYKLYYILLSQKQIKTCCKMLENQARNVAIYIILYIITIFC